MHDGCIGWSLCLFSNRCMSCSSWNSFQRFSDFPWSFLHSSRTGISIQDLIGLCSQAPFDRDEETVVDKTVRSCWQLDPEKFTICDTPSWNKAFEELKAAASCVLAPGLKPHKVELRLYKLLVYNKGSFFLPHRDTQKTENHFGTVVLSMPVKHKGGELFVHHNGQERCYNLDPRRLTAKCQWAAFYTDVEHEITSHYTDLSSVQVHVALLKYLIWNARNV